MRITAGLLQERCGLIQPKFAKHLDLANCNIVTLEGLRNCSNLQTLILRHNSISIIPDAVSSLPELWKLDLSHNLICSLEGLLKVRCIGTLILSFNNITWSELRKLQHIVILDLRLIGNPSLEKDPYYRRHVVDCLPAVWMLDGVLVTAAEREQVARFFRSSEVLERPVRHKLRPLTQSKFIPSRIRNLSRQEVLGSNALRLLSKFSQSEQHTMRTDYRRLRFLAECYQGDLALQRSYWSLLARSGILPPASASPIPAYLQTALTYTSNTEVAEREDVVEEEEGEESPPGGFCKVPPLLRLLACREQEAEKCNMLLLLLVAGLEFALPVSLIEETLATANLASVGGVSCVELLQLPHEDLLLTCSLLLSSVIVDRGSGEQGGLYRRLFVALYVILSNLLRTTHGQPHNFQLKFMSPVSHRSLLAAEVVQLMCLVPSFINLVDRDQGVLDLVAIATQNPFIKDTIQDIMWNSPESDFEEVSGTILQMVRMAIAQEGYDMLELEPGIVPYQTPLSTVSLQTNKKIDQRARSAVASRRKRSTRERVPQLGDLVNLTRQRKGRIIGLHHDQLALIQISALPVTPLREACGEYIYVDMQFMSWDHLAGLWRQQQHVQEFASEPRLARKPEKCYSVISSEGYSRYRSGQLGTEDSATSEIGEAYYVHHDSKQLQLSLDDEGREYISSRAADGASQERGATPFAPEEEVQVRVTPKREVVPVMKKVLEHATDHTITRQNPLDSKTVNSVDMVQLYRPPTTPTSTVYAEHEPDPDLTITPRTDIKVVPLEPSSCETPRTIDIGLRTPPANAERPTRWTSKSARKAPRTPVRLSPDPHPVENPLFTQQKSLPDVSGISLFAYSMGRVGFIKPPDVTDQLATSRSKDNNRNRFSAIGRTKVR